MKTSGRDSHHSHLICLGISHHGVMIIDHRIFHHLGGHNIMAMLNRIGGIDIQIDRDCIAV